MQFTGLFIVADSKACEYGKPKPLTRETLDELVEGSYAVESTAGGASATRMKV